MRHWTDNQCEVSRSMPLTPNLTKWISEDLKGFKTEALGIYGKRLSMISKRSQELRNY